MPFSILASAIVVSGGVEWQPPVSWKTTLGRSGQPIEIGAVAADQTGLYVGGKSRSAFLKKFDFNGREVWSRQLGNLGSTPIDTLNVGPDGLYLTGFHWGSNDSVFVEKHDLNGNWVWTKTANGVSRGYSWAVSVSNSRLYVSGVNASGTIPLSSYDLNGDIVWTISLPGTADGVVLLSADSNGVYLATHAFIARYDTSGFQVWSRQFDDSLGFKCVCNPYGLSEDASGVYVGGFTDRSLPGETAFTGTIGGSFLRKYDVNGSVVWTTGQAGNSIGKISANQSGIYLISGNYIVDPLERYDGANGNRLWSVSDQGSSFDIASISDIAAGENGVYTGGSLVAGGALLVGYDKSASLVLAGVNPPYSFILAGLVLGTIPIGTFLARRQLKKHRLASLPSKG
jgi:putative pyrroloquinoline-quinone binding quinoprotein